MTVSINYLRGAFIAYEPGGYPDRKRVIPFRFNPESLSRQLSIEQGGGGGAGPAPAGAGGAGSPAGEQGADASSGALKEAFSVQIRVDLAERFEGADPLNLAPELGVGPEIAALEELLHPVEAEAEAPSDGTEPTRARPRRWTVLFVWGRRRVYPIRITGMTINETMHNAELSPVRAEIDVSAEVLGDADARDNVAVRSALDFTASNRRKLAQTFFDQTASRGSKIIPL